MRVAWFTPLSEQTGIAKYSLSAALAVSRLAEVDIWTTPRPDDHPTSLTVRDLRDPAERARLGDYDHLIYNFGNYPEMHADIFEVYSEHPGVVIQHDKTMAHFMRVYYTVMHSEARRYRDLLAYYCGADVAARASRQILGLEGGGEAALIEPCLWNATGVVVHSEDALPLVDRYPGLVPVTSIEHPFYLPVELSADDTDRASLGIADDAVLIVSHGRMGESKRLEQTLVAISLLPQDLRERVQFVFASGGHHAQVEQLLSRVRALGLSDHFRITGFLPERGLHAWLAAADIFVNLRYPSTESASGSLIEQLAYPTPIVVSDIGFYASFPADTLVRTPPADEGDAISSALASLVGDEELRRATGARTRAYAQTRFDSARYGRSLVEFLECVESSRRLSQAVGRLGEGLLGVTPEQVRPEVARIIEQRREW